MTHLGVQSHFRRRNGRPAQRRHEPSFVPIDNSRKLHHLASQVPGYQPFDLVYHRNHMGFPYPHTGIRIEQKDFKWGFWGSSPYVDNDN